MEELRQNNLNPVPPDHYGRNSLQKRTDTLDEWGLIDLEYALNNAGLDFDRLKNCIGSPDWLPDDKVEDCMRELALIISFIKSEFKKDSPNSEERKKLNSEVEKFIKKYEF